MKKFVAKVATSLAAAGLLGLSACGPYMEATRPNPVNLANYSDGNWDRNKVGEQLGKPLDTVASGKNSCDVYNLYVRGIDSRGEKVALAAGESVVDVMFLGLPELMFSLSERDFDRQDQGTVYMCYGPDNKVVSAREYAKN